MAKKCPNKKKRCRRKRAKWWITALNGDGTDTPENALTTYEDIVLESYAGTTLTTY